MKTYTWIGILSLLAAFGANAGDVLGDRGNIGTNHTLAGSWSTILGGSNNVANTNWTIVGGGAFNSATATWAQILGGKSNLANATYAVVVGGLQNTNAGPYGFIGAGYENYCADESGVVGGGYRNSDVGYYSAIVGGAINLIGTNYGQGNGAFIGGGAYNTNMAGWSSIVGGYKNDLFSGTGGFIGGGAHNFIQNPFVTEIDCIAIVGGSFNTGLGGGSFIGGGQSNTNIAYWTAIGGGYRNLTEGDEISGALATIPGGAEAKTTHWAQFAYASGAFAAQGDAQMSMYVLRRTTTTSTQAELFLDGAGERMTIPSGATWTFEIQVSARSTANTSAGYLVSGVIDNIGGTTSFVGSPTVTTLGEDVGAWDVTVEADNTNDALVIKVTGANSTTIRWVATVRTTEVRQ